MTVDTFISSCLNTVDGVIGNLVKLAYVNFIQANYGVITLLFTMYVMFIGYQIIHHHPFFNMSTIMRHVLILLCVYGLIMNWQLYHLFIYNIFTNEPEHIAKILIQSADKNSSGLSIVNSLDGIYNAIINASSRLFGQVSFYPSSFVFAVYALLVFLIGIIMCIIALLLFIYAKMMMAILLALGPLFIMFILWNTTKNLFASWLQTLLTLALIPIITSAILMVMLSVIQVTLPNINAPIQELQFYGIAPFLSLSLATALILSQVLKISSALGSGIMLASLSRGNEIAQAAMERSGAAWAGRGIMNWSKNKANQFRRR